MVWLKRSIKIEPHTSGRMSDEEKQQEKMDSEKEKAKEEEPGPSTAVPKAPQNIEGKEVPSQNVVSDGPFKVRGHVSVEEAMLHPNIQRERKAENERRSKLPKHKSSSLDAIQANDSNNNRNVPSKADFFFKGRLFRSLKISPNPAQDVFTVNTTLCGGTESDHGVCSKKSSKGETRVDVNVIRSNDSMENICRICHDSPSSEKLIKPCLCKGSMGTVHRTCLERWLGESGKGTCEICGQEFNTVRVPKYTGIRSFCAWIRHPLNPTDSRNFFFDLACFFILTPLALLSGWLCIVGAQTYATEQQHKSARVMRRKDPESVSMRANRDISNSTWTSIGLLSLTGTLVAAYLIWIFVAFRYHIQVWREWQLRNYIVTIVPLANGEFCFPPEETENHEQRGRANDNNNVGGGVARRNVQEGSDENLNEDEGSPTTRFIQHFFIPSITMRDAVEDAYLNNNSANHSINKEEEALPSIPEEEATEEKLPQQTDHVSIQIKNVTEEDNIHPSRKESSTIIIEPST